MFYSRGNTYTSTTTCCMYMYHSFYYIMGMFHVSYRYLLNPAPDRTFTDIDNISHIDASAPSSTFSGHIWNSLLNHFPYTASLSQLMTYHTLSLTISSCLTFSWSIMTFSDGTEQMFQFCSRYEWPEILAVNFPVSVFSPMCYNGINGHKYRMFINFIHVDSRQFSNSKLSVCRTCDHVAQKLVSHCLWH